MTTTWRKDWTTAVLDILEDESAAHPTHLRKVLKNRPGSFGELPCAYISGRDETITHDAGNMVRTMTGGSVTIVDNYRDNQQTGDLLDELVDFLVERFDLFANVQRVPRSIIELNAVTDVDVEVVSTERTLTYRGVVLSLGRSFITEGRQ